MRISPMAIEAKRLRTQLLVSLADAIANKPSLRESIVLQGGATLHFAYASPRYTDDLDFVWASSPTDRKGAIKALCELEITDPTGQLIRGQLKKDNGKLVRIGFTANSRPGFAPTINLEGYDAPPHLGYREYRTPYGNLRVERSAELLVDKVVACLARTMDPGRIKPGDVFDIFYLTALFEDQMPSLTLLQIKAKQYGLDFSDSVSLARLVRQTVDLIRSERGSIEIALRKQLEPAYAKEFLFERMFEVVLGKLGKWTPS